MKQGPFDITKRVEVTRTKEHPAVKRGLVKEGSVSQVGLVLADDFRKKGFVK
jgi:hypothetical protein